MGAADLQLRTSEAQSRELCDLTISAASHALHSGHISAEELTEAYLHRIGALNPELNSYITITAQRALEDAAQASDALVAGKSRGLLHGIPIALSDMYKTAGVRTTAGSKIHSEYIPKIDSAAARRLRASGTVLLGKLNIHEYAYGVTNDNPHFGIAHNPWSNTHIAGGSSGGAAAAVAAGMALATLGTDTGGNLRIPAAACGVVGLKPTYGRASKAGVIPLSHLFDHVGPLTRTVADAAIMLQAIAGHDRADNTTMNTPAPDFRSQINDGISGLKIGIPREYFFDHLEDDVRFSVEQAIEDFRALGATICEIDLDNAGSAVAATADLVLAAAQKIHRKALTTRPFDFGEDVHELLAAPSPDPIALRLAMRRCGELTRTVQAAFTQVDLLLTPTLPIIGAKIGATKAVFGDLNEALESAMIRHTAPFNATGHPALSLPCGFTKEGLPIGLQIVGRMFDEVTLVRAGHTYEQAKEWHLKAAPLPTV